VGFSLGSLISSWWRRERLKRPEFGPGTTPIKLIFINIIRLYKLASIRVLSLSNILWCREIRKILGSSGVRPVPATVRAVVVVRRGGIFSYRPYFIS
jgi:hypothetical protein